MAWNSFFFYFSCHVYNRCKLEEFKVTFISKGRRVYRQPTDYVIIWVKETRSFSNCVATWWPIIGYHICIALRPLIDKLTQNTGGLRQAHSVESYTQRPGDWGMELFLHFYYKTSCFRYKLASMVPESNTSSNNKQETWSFCVKLALSLKANRLDNTTRTELALIKAG